MTLRFWRAYSEKPVPLPVPPNPAGPRLAGQSHEYLVEAMRRFADGERTNNAYMMNLMKAISPADREAMARYISGI